MNIVLFLNSFLSYLLLFGVIVVLALIAVGIGITMRKKKNAKEAAAVVDTQSQES